MSCLCYARVILQIYLSDSYLNLSIVYAEANIIIIEFEEKN